MENLSSPHAKNLARGLRITATALFLIFSAFPLQSANSLNVIINKIAWPVKAAYAANGLKMGTVVINEISWMGTKVGEVESKNWWRYEWLELYNNTDQPISLDGWKIELYRTTLDWSLVLNGDIPAQGYLLIVASDKIFPDYDLNYSNLGGKLVNSGQRVLLKDGVGQVIDEIDCSAGWFAGDNTTKQTMERKSSQLSGNNTGNWQTSQVPGGTPKIENTKQRTEELAENSSLPTEKETEAGSLPADSQLKPAENGSPPIIYPAGIVFNEILPSPEGADETEEWIEIFNENGYDVDIPGWQISDVAGAVTSYAFEPGTIIKAKSFLVLARPITKITLNNNGDGLNLTQPDGKIVDSVSYEKAPRGQSYNRTPLENDSLTGQTEGDWVWSSTLTPNSVNITSLPVVQSEITQKETTKPNKELQEKQSQKQQLAAIGEQASGIFDSLYIFLIALGSAIFSGVIIFVLKRKIKTMGAL